MQTSAFVVFFNRLAGNKKRLATFVSKIINIYYMKKTSIILAILGVALLFLLFLCDVDVFDEQAFRWRLEYWMFTGSFVCFAVSLILCAIRTKKMVSRIVLALLSLLPLYAVVDMVRGWPWLIYSDSHYQIWVNSGINGEYLEIYYGTGLVMDDAGGTSSMPWGDLDSCRVELHDDLGVIWVESWTSYQGKPFEHEGRLVPIDSRFSKGNYKMHTIELDSLLASYIHDTVPIGKWYYARVVLD
ncbi:MAG: hypothetical protein K6F29_00090 [Bacteroidales bacterium]|nr:hypothetical protein [Bacteroidales bacterium]